MAGLLKGIELKKKDGSSVDAETALNGKIVGLYFSAHWCPPCRMFTPVLKDFYNEINEDGFEIVFLSYDNSEEELQSYLEEAHGDWFYLTFGHEKIEEIDKVFEIDGIPTLVIVKPDGTLITKDGRGVVSITAPKTALTNWKNA